MDALIGALFVLFWFIVILIPLVAIHEFGHLLISRLFGVKILEYGIGIPPRIFFRKWKGIIWSLNWIPLGGFARIYGDHDAIDDAQDQYKTNPKAAKSSYVENRLAELLSNKDLQFFLEDNNIQFTPEWKAYEHQSGEPQIDQEADYEIMTTQVQTLIEWEFESKLESTDTFFSKKLYQKILILLGGVLFNLITAVTIFWIMFAFLSVPPQTVLVEDIAFIEENFTITQRDDNISVFFVIEDSPAWKGGLRPGDQLLRFDSKDPKEFTNFSDFTASVQDGGIREIPVQFKSAASGDIVNSNITLEENDGKPYFGIQYGGLGYIIRYRSKTPWAAIPRSAEYTGRILLMNFQAIGDIVAVPFTGNTQPLDNLGGPVKVGRIGGLIYDIQGASGILSIMASLSISLAAFNLLPIPALDGGRIVIVIMNAIMGKRNKKVEGIIIGLSFVALLGMMLLVSAKDIWQAFNSTGAGF